MWLTQARARNSALHRSEMTVVQRSEQVARWVQLADRVSAQVAPKPQGGRPEKGVNKASRDLNIERTEVQRAVKIASLAPEAKAANLDKWPSDGCATSCNTSIDRIVRAAAMWAAANLDKWPSDGHVSHQGTHDIKRDVRAAAMWAAAMWAAN